MQKFQVMFKNDNDRKIVLISMILGILFGFIPFIISYFAFSNDLSEQSKKIIGAYLNFELLIFVIYLALQIVPVINILAFLLTPIAFIINLIIIVKALSAINNNKTEIDIPVIMSIF